MPRSLRSRTTLCSLLIALAFGSSALAQGGGPAPKPAKPGASQHDHDAKHDEAAEERAAMAAQDHDGEDDEGPAAAAAPAKPPKPLTPEDEARRKQVVAKVESAEITVGKIEDYLAQQSPLLRARYKDPEELKKLVDNMVRFELLAGEAERRGYDKNKVVVRTNKDGAVQNLLRTEIEDKVTPASVSMDEVKAYYEANSVEFHRPAMRRASQILVDSEAEAKQLLAQAQKADAQGFIELAKQHSKDLETKLRGGDLGYFGKEPAPGVTESNVGPAVRKAAFELKNVGDTSPKPVAIDGGFVILRITGDRPERSTSLQEAEHSIRTKLWREKRQKAMTDLVEGLRARDKPKVEANLVDLVKLEDMDKQPAGFTPEPTKNKQVGKPVATP